MSGDVFIFINKRRDKIKLLMWDSNGFAICYKELEKGTFGCSEIGKNTLVELVWSDLVMLLEYIEISSGLATCFIEEPLYPKKICH